MATGLVTRVVAVLPMAKPASETAKAPPLPSGGRPSMASVPAVGAVHVHADGLRLPTMAEGRNVLGPRCSTVLPTDPGATYVGVSHPSSANGQDVLVRRDLTGKGVTREEEAVAHMAGRHPRATCGVAAVASRVVAERVAATFHAARGSERACPRALANWVLRVPAGSMT